MEGDDCNFSQDSADNVSQRGSVASSATLSRGMSELTLVELEGSKTSPQSISVLIHKQKIVQSGIP